MPITVDSIGGSYIINSTVNITDYTRNGLTTILNGYIGLINNYILNNTDQDNYTVGCDYGLNTNDDSITKSYTYDHGTTNRTYDGTAISIVADTTQYVVSVNKPYVGMLDGWTVDPKTIARDRKRSNIRSKLTPVVKVRSEAIRGSTPEECLAMETLREAVSEDEFKKYLRYGFVLVHGRSGATYQVFRNRSHVKVWVGGKLIEEICVYLKAVDGKAAPATDKVVAFKTMIEADEEAFKAMGNRYRMAA